MKHSQEERGKKSPKNNKKISQTTKHSASVLCQSSVLCFPPDCVPRKEEINQKQDIGSFSLGLSFHRERRDYAEKKSKKKKSQNFFCNKPGKKDVWYRWENVKETDDTISEREEAAILAMM